MHSYVIMLGRLIFTINIPNGERIYIEKTPAYWGPHILSTCAESITNITKQNKQNVGMQEGAEPHIQTHIKMDNKAYRLNRPKSQFSENTCKLILQLQLPEVRG